MLQQDNLWALAGLPSLEQLKQARIKAQEKKHEMKQLKSKAKQLPIEKVKLNAFKYD
jgi:hypothetical protein